MGYEKVSKDVWEVVVNPSVMQPLPQTNNISRNFLACRHADYYHTHARIDSISYML